MTANVDNGKAQFPLAGVVMCCTSISPEKRTELAGIAIQMGAVHKYDLTSDVTHLIVGSIDTLKYKYVAKERPDVKVVVPAWISAVRDLWLEGEDADVTALEVEYQVPPFYGLRLCVTGFDDRLFHSVTLGVQKLTLPTVSQRKEISETITQNGAEYHGDLTKIVTHLIAARPEGKKYSYACQWKIKIVGPEWLRDSVLRGMVLDEDLYHPSTPSNERGRGAWNREILPGPQGKRPGDAQTTKSMKEPDRKKLRRTTSLRFGSQSERIWADITSGGANKNDLRDNFECLTTNNLTEGGNTSLDRSSRNSENFDINPDGDRERIAKFRETCTGLFQGRPVFALGFENEKMAILEKHLVGNDADVLIADTDLLQRPQEELNQGFLLVPHDIDISYLRIPPAAQSMMKVTEWWVEKCLHRKAFIEPRDDLLCQPFWKGKIKGFENMVFASTSFSGVDLMHTTKAIKILGGSYDEFLKKTSSVLLCNSMTPNKEKLKFATAKGIPAVSANWLWDCIRSGLKHSFDGYLLASTQQNAAATKPSYVEQPTQPLSTDERTKSDERRAARAAERRDSEINAPSNPVLQDSLSRNTSRNSSSSSTRQPLLAENLDPKSKIERRHSDLEDKLSPSPARDDSLKASEGDHDNEGSAATKQGTTQHLASDIVALLAEKQSHGSISANGMAVETNRDRRRRGLLGRAVSALSDGSKGAKPSQESSVSQYPAQDLDTEENYDDKISRSDKLPPSQALIYDDPELQKAREAMIRKMGGRVEGDTPRVQSIGAVKNVHQDTVNRASRRKGR